MSIEHFETISEHTLGNELSGNIRQLDGEK